MSFSNAMRTQSLNGVDQLICSIIHELVTSVNETSQGESLMYDKFYACF